MTSFSLFIIGFLTFFGSLCIFFRTKNIVIKAIFKKEDEAQSFLSKYGRDLVGMINGLLFLLIALYIYLKEYEKIKQLQNKTTIFIILIVTIVALMAIESYFEVNSPKPKRNKYVNKNRIPSPCPECGDQLRTSQAQQCFSCGAAWHK